MTERRENQIERLAVLDFRIEAAGRRLASFKARGMPTQALDKMLATMIESQRLCRHGLRAITGWSAPDLDV
jgi:hypothetical protein